MANKEKKKYDWDDGRTIAPMNGDELPKYRRMAYLNREKRPSKEERQKLKNAYTKKEKRAIMRAGFLSLLPMMLISLCAFAIVALLLWAWLK